MPEMTPEESHQFSRDLDDAESMSRASLSFRYARSLSVLRAVWKSRRELQAQLGKSRYGAKTLGSIVDRQCRNALDATGLHHLIDEDGDGDWGLVWEHLAEMGADLRAARARIAELEGPASEAARDDLAQLIANHLPVTGSTPDWLRVEGHFSPRAVADAAIAAGWRAPIAEDDLTGGAQ